MRLVILGSIEIIESVISNCYIRMGCIGKVLDVVSLPFAMIQEWALFLIVLDLLVPAVRSGSAHEDGSTDPMHTY